MGPRARRDDHPSLEPAKRLPPQHPPLPVSRPAVAQPRPRPATRRNASPGPDLAALLRPAAAILAPGASRGRGPAPARRSRPRRPAVGRGTRTFGPAVGFTALGRQVGTGHVVAVASKRGRLPALVALGGDVR
jgi:hypothetical protein